MSNDPSPVDRTTVIDVEGMTCAHCVAAVTEELSAVPDVSKVSVILRDGGTSEATVVSDAVLDQDALRAAVDEAGYTVTAIHVDD
ncbi:heavy-metal-associated domain-containing protein [Georgenia sunbinii]|uniref:heavy-metal-associated domain-containing protein n=1 Tax=Georgenia sunbinii TaxID=3117728 RepID=UPI002F26C1E4